MTTVAHRVEAPIEDLEVQAFTVPTDAPEADGTLAWDATTIVVVHAFGAGEWGLGYTYADLATARLIASKLRGVVEGTDALDPPAAWLKMVGAIRNLGRPGICSMAISAVDVALWDLKARLLGLPLCKVLGMAHDAVPVYGSGGFTSYPVRRLQQQLGGWVSHGIPRVKMKVGSDPDDDPARVRAARDAIGHMPELFVDANGAYSRKQALALGERFRDEAGVGWFEEPVSSDDLEGLRLMRDRCPAGMAVAAGEYGYDLPYFERMLHAGRSTSCRQTSRAVAGSRNCCASTRCAARARCRSRCTADRRSICTRGSPSGNSSTSSTSMITCGSRRCCSTVFSRRWTAPCIPISTGRASGSSSSGRRPHDMPRNAKRWWRNVSRGRMQRTLSAATAASALPLGLEIYFEHFRGSFGDKWMWTPVALSPALTIAGIAGVRSERAARTWLPALSALYAIDGLIGTITHIRGVARKPGGFQEPLFNIVMGPPLLAPGSLALVGGMGLAAAAFGRER